MKTTRIPALVAAGSAAAILGFATPAQALPQILQTVTAPYVGGIDHHNWINDIQPDVSVPKVDSSVRHSGR